MMIPLLRRSVVPSAMLTSLGLGLSILGSAALSCVISPVAQDILKLRGQDYVELPEGLCPGYSDMLLGKAGRFEYGGVVCDRNEGSYLWLQRLVGYNTEKKAIWKVLQIRGLAQLDDSEQMVSNGCEHIRDRKQRIFAVVDTESAPNYKTQRAWAVNLHQETLIPISPRLAVCRDPIF